MTTTKQTLIKARGLIACLILVSCSSSDDVAPRKPKPSYDIICLNEKPEYIAKAKSGNIYINSGGESRFLGVVIQDKNYRYKLNYTMPDYMLCEIKKVTIEAAE